jgi:4-diphosphocytidyl-2-C-methyl-D-erythritol kinase
MDGSLRIAAPAKVNLHLSVGGVRTDGYHEVRTVLHALDFGDSVTIAPSAGFSVLCEPPIDVAPERNLAYRAARAMEARYGRELAVAVRIDKRIPAGAGLGGASADAAAVIAGLASAWDLGDDAGLEAVARSLGADGPFLIEGGAALLGERGDVPVRRLPPLDVAVVLAKPADPVSTAAAYAAFDAAGGSRAFPPRDADDLIEAFECADPGGVAAALANNLTDAAVGLVPAIADALACLEGAPGVLGVALTGSGSAVFGICADDAAAARARDLARERGFWSVATRTSPHGCRVSGD